MNHTNDINRNRSRDLWLCKLGLAPAQVAAACVGACIATSVLASPGSQSALAGSDSYVFEQPFPNPFVGAIQLHYSLGTTMSVDLRIFDASGRLVRTLVHDVLDGGGNVTWDGTADDGTRVARGVYFYRFEAHAKIWERGRATFGKLVLMR